MPKTAYNISLKGYVGGLDFYSSKVDKELAKNEDKEINLVIDSLGGSLAIGWSILYLQESRQAQCAFCRTQCFHRKLRFV